MIEPSIFGELYTFLKQPTNGPYLRPPMWSRASTVIPPDKSNSGPGTDQIKYPVDDPLVITPNKMIQW
jgi:hypothetical protein